MRVERGVVRRRGAEKFELSELNGKNGCVGGTKLLSATVYRQIDKANSDA